MVWPTLESRKANEQNRTIVGLDAECVKKQKKCLSVHEAVFGS